jgi:hypothetical protein
VIAKIHLWPEPPVQKDGFLTLAAVVEIPGKERQRLWYRLPEEYRPAVSRNDDPFIPGVLFSVMKTRADVHIHGEVSPSLLRNLVEYQAAWACWLPQNINPTRSVRMSNASRLDRTAARPSWGFPAAAIRRLPPGATAPAAPAGRGGIWSPGYSPTVSTFR